MSSKNKKQEVIHTKIWREEPEPDNPFAAKKCFCAGYDVYGDLLGKASWAEYLYLLFKLEKPTKQQAKLLETIAVAIANPGIRDHSVRAAMNAGVGGSTSASALISSLAVGAGQYTGAREVYLLMENWQQLGVDINNWDRCINASNENTAPDIWPDITHFPGFDSNADTCATPILQVLDICAEIDDSGVLKWLKENRSVLENYVGSPLSMVGVISAAFHSLGFSSSQGEMLFLLLRLPGAAVHALEQREHGWRKYPFFGEALKYKE